MNKNAPSFRLCLNRGRLVWAPTALVGGECQWHRALRRQIALSATVNNNEMGVFVQRDQEPDLYRDTYEEAQRLIRISEQVRLSAEKVEDPDQPEMEEDGKGYDKLTTSKLAKGCGLPTGKLTDQLIAKGWLERDGEFMKLTEAGKQVGGEFRFSKKFGPYFIWPKDIQL